MAEFTIGEVLAATGGKLTCEYRKAFSGVSADTRTLRPGNLFVALKGEKFDAHDFLLRAVDSGAAGVVISNPDVYVPDKVTTVVVADTLMALQDLARFHRRRFSIPVIGDHRVQRQDDHQRHDSGGSRQPIKRTQSRDQAQQ